MTNFEKQQELGERLAESWHRRSPFGRMLGNTAMSYVSALGSLITSQLLDGSAPDNSSEAFIYAVQDSPVVIKVLARNGSPLEEKAERGNVLRTGGFVEIDESTIRHSLVTYSQDRCASLVLPYLADSLRKKELELSGLNLKYLTPGNDIIKVTLKEEEY